MSQLSNVGNRSFAKALSNVKPSQSSKSTYVILSPQYITDAASLWMLSVQKLFIATRSSVLENQVQLLLEPTSEGNLIQSPSWGIAEYQSSIIKCHGQKWPSV